MTSTPTVRPIGRRVAGTPGAIQASSPVVSGETPDGNLLLTNKQAAEYITCSPHGLEKLP